MRVNRVVLSVAVLVIVTILLIPLRTTWLRNVDTPKPSHSIVTVTGKALPGFFSGLTPNKLYASPHRRLAPSPCSPDRKPGSNTSQKISWFQRILGPTVVHAQCPTQGCTGSNWVASGYTCAAGGGGCSGSITIVIQDPDHAGPCDGFCQPGTGCDFYYCGCNSLHCDSCSDVCNP
jgi:hypothetical protein